MTILKDISVVIGPFGSTLLLMCDPVWRTTPTLVSNTKSHKSVAGYIILESKIAVRNEQF